MSLATMIKQLYAQTIGGTAPSGAALSTGDIGQMIKYLVATPASAQAPRQLLPGRITPPADVVISGSVSLTERINYFNNLTINNGVVLTGLAGGTILVVEGTLALLNASSQITVDALGGKGGAAAGGAGNFGAGGGLPFSTGIGTPPVNNSGALSIGTASAANPAWFVESPWVNNSAGGAGGSNAAAGSAGVAWTNQLTPLQSTAAAAPAANFELWLSLLRCIQARLGIDNATYGAIGGGGGGSGAGGAAAGAGGAGGTLGCSGAVGAATAAGGGGGAGLGGGGGGGGGANAGSGSGGAGGRGGGVLLILCKTLNNAGIISADGAVGGAAGATNAGGGGGGGGGVVGIGYETLTALGTVRANGGALGALAGTGFNGAAGAAGQAFSFKIRSGV